MRLVLAQRACPPCPPNESLGGCQRQLYGCCWVHSGVHTSGTTDKKKKRATDTIDKYWRMFLITVNQEGHTAATSWCSRSVNEYWVPPGKGSRGQFPHLWHPPWARSAVTLQQKAGTACRCCHSLELVFSRETSWAIVVVLGDVKDMGSRTVCWFRCTGR